MVRLRVTLKLLGLLCAAGLCLGATYTWTAGGDNDYWANGENWDVSGIGNCAYPCSTSDDATIEYDAGGYTVVLEDDTEIDDLTIEAGVEFLGAGATPTLTLDSLTLSALSAAITVEISAATISVP